MMFDPRLAKEVGINQAIVLQKLRGWQNYNRRQQKRSHFRRGVWWTYGTAEYWQTREFIWISEATVRRVFKDLEQAGHILIDAVGKGADYRVWLSVLDRAISPVMPAVVNLQPALFNLETAVADCAPTIGNHTTSKRPTRNPTTTKARAMAAVAEFKTISSTGDLVERTPDIPEVHASESDEGSDDAQTPPPNSAAPLPQPIREAFPTDTPAYLARMIAQHGEARVLELVTYARKQAWVKSVPAVVKSWLREGFTMPEQVAVISEQQKWEDYVRDNPWLANHRTPDDTPTEPDLTTENDTEAETAELAGAS